MTAIDAHTTETREARRNAVAQFFSASTRYWRSIYEQNPDETDRLYRTNIVDRKNAVLRMLATCTAEIPSRILDVGCGPGVFMQDVLAGGHTIVGMDIADQMAKAAKVAVERHYNDRAFCVVGDVERLPFDDNSFDVVLCIGVLSYVNDEASSMGEMSRVVRKGGSIILAVPNKLRMSALFDPCYPWDRTKALLRGRRDRMRAGVTGSGSEDVMKEMRRFSRGQLAPFLRGNNLREVEVRGLGYGPMTFWKKDFVPAELSLKISRCLEGLARSRPLSFVSLFANHFVYHLQKNDAHREAMRTKRQRCAACDHEGKTINRELLEILACPRCRSRLSQDSAGAYFICSRCTLRFPVVDGIPLLLSDTAESLEQSRER